MPVFTYVRRFSGHVFCVAMCTLLASGRALAQFDTIITIPTDDSDIGVGASIASDTQLNLLEEGAVGAFFDVGAEDGGSTNIEVNVLGGQLGAFSEAFDGSVINIVDGIVARSFQAHTGSTVNISGGSIGGGLQSRNGSVVNISGGSLGQYFRAHAGGIVNISGGVIEDHFEISDNARVTVSGGDFRLDGELIAGLEAVGSATRIDLGDDSVLSGVLTDGSLFKLSSLDGDSIADNTLTLTAAEVPPIGPPEINVPNDPVPLSLRSGQVLTVESGGAVGDDFVAFWNSSVHVRGGEVGENLQVLGAAVSNSNGIRSS